MKKKVLAIILSVVMVFAAVAVLSACNAKEYTVKFRNNSGREYFRLTTVDGKISKEAVDAETAKLSNGDQMFMGWYGTIDQVDGVYVYDNEIDYDKVYTADAEYYAYWHVAAGLAQGYTMIGVINGTTIWTPGEEPDEWMLEQDKAQPWLYRVTLDVKAGDALKVKEKSTAWKDICNLGYDGLAEIIVGAGVTLPEGVTKDDIIYGSGDSNVFISGHVVSMNITVEYDASILKFRITINEGEILAEEPEYHYILVGSLAEGNWDNSLGCSEALYFQETEAEGVYTIDYTFTKGNEWKVTINNGAWSWELGGDKINSIVAAADIDVTNETEVADDDLNMEAIIAASFKGSGNISVTYDCTVTITIDVNEGTIDIVVNAITVDVADVEPDDVRWAIAGTMNNWTGDDMTDFILTGDETTVSITLDLAADAAFKVKQMYTWDTAKGYSDVENSITAANGLDIAGLFEASDGNIKVNSACNVTITVDVATGAVSIVVNSIAA